MPCTCATSIGKDLHEAEKSLSKAADIVYSAFSIVPEPDDFSSLKDTQRDRVREDLDWHLQNVRAFYNEDVTGTMNCFNKDIGKDTVPSVLFPQITGH